MVSLVWLVVRIRDRFFGWAWVVTFGHRSVLAHGDWLYISLVGSVFQCGSCYGDFVAATYGAQQLYRLAMAGQPCGLLAWP